MCGPAGIIAVTANKHLDTYIFIYTYIYIYTYVYMLIRILVFGGICKCIKERAKNRNYLIAFDMQI